MNSFNQSVYSTFIQKYSTWEYFALGCCRPLFVCNHSFLCAFFHCDVLQDDCDCPTCVSPCRCLCLQESLWLANAARGSTVWERRPPAEHPYQVPPGPSLAAPSRSGHVRPALRHVGSRPKLPTTSGAAGIQSARFSERGLPLTQSGLPRP